LRPSPRPGLRKELQKSSPMHRLWLAMVVALSINSSS
jgi:hypothetical protein